MDEPATPQKPLTYEETPIIEPIEEKPTVVASPPPAPAPTTTKPLRPGFLRKFFRFLLNFLGLVILFFVGVWLSTILRQFLPTGIGQGPTEEIASIAPTPTTPASPTALWTAYPVLSAATKLPVPGISFKLPPEVLAPVCDGASCASQGTYLPGGTRFTVSLRGTSLTFMQRAIITDSAGRAFTSNEAIVSGSPAIEYTGSFRGTTTGGYTFTQMRGFMIQVTNSQTLEFNHFAPTGVTVDFAADDTLFNKILETLVLPLAPTPSVSPSFAPTATPIATPSG